MTLAAAALALSLAAAPAGARTPPKAPDGHNARNAVDWDGTYMGTLASGSGSGYRTVLVLRKDGRYTLMQDIEHKGKTESFSSSGRFRWDNGGSVITLGNQPDAERFFVSEGYVEQRGDAPPPPNMAKDYQLTKMLSYAGGKEELLIDSTSIQSDQPRLGWVSFQGVWNMNHATQAGHRSLAANFQINCAKREYRMPTLTYYSQPFKRGKVIDSARNNDNDIPITPQDRTMTRVMKDHCPQR